MTGHSSMCRAIALVNILSLNWLVGSPTCITDAPTGEQLFKLKPSRFSFIAEGDWFGYSVANSRGTAIVGSPKDNDNGDDSGSAYLFDTTTGSRLFKLKPNDGDRLDQFGYSVAISGNTAIVGNSGDDDNGFAPGSEYLFDVTTGKQQFKLTPDDGEELDLFGYSVAISGDTAIVVVLVP